MNLFNNNIKFMHFRQFNNDGTVNARGGVTVAYYQGGDVFTFAFSKCNTTDNYSRHMGRLVAVQRLKNPQNIFRFTDVQDFREHIEEWVNQHTGYVRQYGKRKGKGVLKNMNASELTPSVEGLTAN